MCGGRPQRRTSSPEHDDRSAVIYPACSISRDGGVGQVEMRSMEHPEAYIPIDRRLALVRGEDLPDRTRGAALFADISGFTPLTERLAKELGPQRGAEELTQQLNVIYSALIAQVDQYRGAVISFSGDAITCWFDDNSVEFSVLSSQFDLPGTQNSKLKTQNWAALRALACASAMQRVMGDLAEVATPSGATVTLAIKVAIAAGPVRRFLVGDPPVQRFDVLAGATLDRLAAAEHHAEKGEIVASAEVLAGLENVVAPREWRSGEAPGERFAVIAGLAHPVPANPWPALPADALASEHSRPWLLPMVYERLSAGQGQFLAELRPAVALFARFGGIDYDGDAGANAKLDAYIHWVQGIVARYEGALLQLTIGDKGSYFYVAFGAPVAHDDDPARAVAAALELQALPPELAGIVGTQIGISRGRMRTGAYGGPTRRTYGVLGDEVNMAARLMGKAELGQILVSQPVADAVARRFTLRYVGPISVKGKQAPVQVSLVLDRRVPSTQRPSTLFSGVLVGREPELARMSELLLQAQTVGGQVLRLVGAAGVGKSHLAAELAERALGWGMRVAVGMCQSTTESIPYAPWRQVLRALLGLSAEPGAGEDPATTHAGQIAAVERFVAATNPDWLLRLPLLGDLLGLPIPDNATTASFEPRLRQRALYDMVVEMLQIWAQAQPLLLLVDDAHWMDEASKGLAAALARGVSEVPLMLTIAHRPTLHADPLLTELNELASYRRIDLDELSPQGVATLVANRLGGSPSPLALSLIQAETQGNPFFVEEVVDALRESGNLYRRDDGEWWLAARMFEALGQANLLTREEERWVLAPDASLSAVDLGLPDSIQGVVLSRIDRLPEAHKLTLKIASVIGRTFALDLLRQIHPASPAEADLVEQIALLEEREFTRLEALQRLIYLFKHTVTRDTAYETLLFDQRRQLHRSVGEVLEWLAPEATAQLAYHSYAGEDWPRALHYQSLAGRQSQKLFANQEGIEHFRKALRAAEFLPPEATAVQRFEIHVGLGELMTHIGQYDAALEHLGAARELATGLDDHDGRARACRWIARVYEHRGDYAQAVEWIQQGLAAIERQETADAAELLAIAGLINTRQGNYELAREQNDRSVQIAEKLGATTSLAFALNSRAIVSILRGNSTSAIKHFQRAAELYGQAENIQGQALSYNGIGNAYFELGQLPSADTYYRRARVIFVQTGDQLHLATVDNNLGEIARYQGRLDEAMSFYSEAVDTLEEMGGSLYMRAILRMNLGATLLQRGDVDGARQYLYAGQEQFAQVNARDFLPELHRHLARAALVCGDHGEAAREAGRSLDLARELAMRGEEGETLHMLGEVAAAEGRLDAAEQHLHGALAILDEVGDEYEGARCRLTLAEVSIAQGRHQAARDALARCVPIFERLEAVLDRDQAYGLRARLL
jgi:predicted ATPase/class 3 adenylate cyclase/Tfp pilus assembly protein PilF